MLNNLDYTATYTLAKADSTIGTAVDELNANNLQNAELLYDDPAAMGPTGRTDARHQGSLAMVWLAKGFTISPIFMYRSRLPVAITAGSDLNLNSENNDLPTRAFQFDGVGNPPKDIGPCETWNCGRGAWRTQMNLRVSRSFRLTDRARIEGIFEMFNLLNAKNPATFVTNQVSPTLHAAERVRGRLPEPRAARRSDRFPFQLLTPKGRPPGRPSTPAFRSAACLLRPA